MLIFLSRPHPGGLRGEDGRRNLPLGEQPAAHVPGAREEAQPL